MFDAIKCINATETLCADFFFGLITNKDPQTIKTHPVDADVCWSMANNETYAAQLNITKHADTIWTSVTNVSMSRGFIGQKCQSVQQYAVQRGSIGSPDGHHIISNILGPNSCDIRQLNCTDETGTVVWNITTDAIFCSHRSRGIFNTAVVKTETTQHLLVPYRQSSFTLAPRQPVPAAVRKCIPGTVVAAGNDAYIRFIPLQSTSTTTPAARQKRAIQWLKLPDKTSTTELTAEQKLLAIQRKIWALREILSIPPAEALFNPDINRLANNRQRKRAERLRNLHMWRKRLIELENHQQKSKQPHERIRTKEAYAPAQMAGTVKTILSPTQPTTTAATPTLPPAVVAFPYVQAKTVLIKRARNGTVYYESSARKKYALTNLPHGSVVWNRTSDELQYVFWQTPDSSTVRLYRHSRWEYAEDRRDGPRFTPTRSTRNNMDEVKLQLAIGNREFLSPQEGQNFAQLWDEIAHRQRLDEVISRMFAGQMDNEDELLPAPRTYQEPQIHQEQQTNQEQQEASDEGEADPEEDYENYEYISSESEEPTDGRQRRNAKTSSEFNYDADNAQDKEHKKHIARRFEKDAERIGHSGQPDSEEDTTPPSTPPKASSDNVDARPAPTDADNSAGTPVYPTDTEQLSHSLNEKIQFTDDEWNIHNARVFRQVYTAICENHNQDVRIIRSLAKFDASTALQTWFRRTDIVAVQAGQAIAVYICTPVLPKEVFWNQEHRNVCYADVPVDVNGTVYFLQAGTNDLKRYSREIPCSQRRPNIYHNGSSWISSTGHRQHVAKLTHHIQFENPELEIDLQGRSLYESDFAEVLTSASMLAGYDRRMNRLEETFVSIQLRTATPILDSIVSAVDDAKQTLNRTLSSAKQSLSGWNPFDWISAWYHYAIIVIKICGIIAAIIGCWYAAPFVLACTHGLRETLRARRRATQFRRERRRTSTHGTEMHHIIAAVHMEDVPQPPKADIQLYEFYPSFALMTVATRHHQREAGVPPSIAIKIRGSDTIIILDTGSYCSVTKKELQYMYDVRFNVEGKDLPFSLLAAEAESGLPNTVIFGCDAISTLNTALGSLKLQFQAREQSWKIQFVETESMSETRAVASCYRLSTATVNDTVLQSMRQGWLALYVAAYINAHSTIGRVDTGSLVSLCKLTTAFKCNLDRQENSEAMPQLRFLGNNCIVPVGRAYATVSIGPYRHRVLIYIVRDDAIPYEHADFVLGDDLLNAIAREYFINAISFTNRLLDEAAERRAQEPLVAHTLEDVVIPPRSDMIFTAGLTGDIDPQADYIIEEKPHAFTMKVGRILVRPRGRTIPMRVLNMATCPVRIPKGATIAYAAQMGDGEPTPAATDADDNYDPTDRMITEIFEAPTEDWDTQIQKLDLSRSVFNHRQKRRLLQSLRKRKRAFVQPDGRKCQTQDSNETQKQLEQLIKNDLIRPSTSPFAAPIQHVSKKDGSYRMVCDYRGLNQQMEPQIYSMPNIQSILDQCAGKKIFSTVDFSQAYHQTEIEEQDIHKSAFITEFGLFEWLVTPYGMANSGDTFSRMMRELASQMSFRLMCFVDDVVLASDSADEHLDHLDEFLAVVEEHNLTLKLSKCTFGEAELHFLGMIISELGMRPNPAKIAAIVNTPIPTTITAMKSFLGAVNYQRRYIPNCATILRPLYEICTGERLGEFGPEQMEAFEKVKQLLTTAPVLASPRIGVGYILETGASKKGLGFVLLQPDKEGNNRVVAYGSRKTTKYEEKKDPCVLEAAAVRWSLEQCAPYLLGNPTTIVRTDNTAVKALLTKEDRNLTSQMNRYRIAIQAYNIRLEHRSGKSNKMADYLSRYVPEETLESEPTNEQQDPPEDAERINAISSDALRLTGSRIRAEQQRESKLRHFYEALSGSRTSTTLAFTANENTKLSRCSLRDGVVCYQAAADAAPRIWLPARLREQAIRELHEDPLAGGHLGTNKVELKVRHRFYWPKMHDDISAIVSSCPGCQYRKAPPKITPTEPLSKWPTPRWPFDRIHLDLYGVLPLTKKRHRYVLTVADALTKWICAIPLKGQTAQEVHDAFLTNVIAKYGVCSCAVTDQGTQFLCKAFDQLASLYGFKHVPVSAHHQASNGQVERFHKTLADMLSNYVADEPSSWDDYLASITMAYNCSVHAITGQSPFWSLYGREPNLPIDLRITLFQEEQTGQDGGIGAITGQAGADGSENETTVAQTERLRQLRRVWNDMKKAIEEKGAVRDAYRDDRVRAKAHQLTEGQLVLKRKPVDEIRSKFDFKFDGPYRLKSIQPPNVTIQKVHENAKPLTLHVDQIKPFKAAITLPIYSDCRDAPSDADGSGLDARTNGEHAEALSGEDSDTAAEREEVNAVRILPPSPHPIAINKNGYWKDVRDHNGRVLIFNTNALDGRPRICAIDLDGTIIRTRSGATFPKYKDDWQFWNENVPEKLRRIHYCDFKICVFTNQLGVSNASVDLEALKSRIEDIYKAVAVPMQFFIAVSEGFYRKHRNVEIARGIGERLRGSFDGTQFLRRRCCRPTRQREPSSGPLKQ